MRSRVSARIRSLEDDHGTTLFHRHNRGAGLTPAGKRLLPDAARRPDPC
jgi:LysR family transcriptional regulator, cell division regulator